MPNLINTMMPANTADDVNKKLVEQLTALKPFKVNLTDEGKKGSRTMAEGREGLARLVSKIASANIESLARSRGADMKAAIPSAAARRRRTTAWPLRAGR